MGLSCQYLYFSLTGSGCIVEGNHAMGPLWDAKFHQLSDYNIPFTKSLVEYAGAGLYTASASRNEANVT